VKNKAMNQKPLNKGSHLCGHQYKSGILRPTVITWYETGLYFRALPTGTMWLKDESLLAAKNERI